MLLTEEGYVDLSASTPAYYYYLKDHQGNNRVVLSSGGTAVEVSHYYPFGGVFASTGNVQPIFRIKMIDLPRIKGFSCLFATLNNINRKSFYNTNLLMLANLRWFIFTLILCTTTCLSAQTYSGVIVEQESGNPLSGTYVALISNRGLLVSWDFSNDDGSFSITVPENKQVDNIHFSLLGYKKYLLPLTDFPSDGYIKMECEDFHLEEVKVSAQRIVNRNDTLVYSVAGFSQPQDRSIADVIAKMPGMEVSDNGQISFNGKNINKFYIEGLDLMGDRYSLAANNISKKRVKSVEILQNHQPIELLRDKSFSEQAAINLVLEDNSKINLIGSSDLGVGINKYDVLYKNRLLAMLFGKKYQTLSIYKNDNTGYDLFAEINPLTMTDLDKEDVMEDGMVSLLMSNTPDIDRSRYTFNKAHLTATNHLFQLANKTNLRAQVSYYNDVSKRNNSIETEYLFTDTIAQTMYEYNAFQEERDRLDASVNLETNHPNLYIKNDLKGTIDWLSSYSTTVLNNIQRNLSSNPDRFFLSDVLDIKLPFSNDRHISISSINNYNKQPQRLTIYSGEVQRLYYNSFHTHNLVSFRHKLFQMYATYYCGFQGLLQTLKANVGEQTSLKEQKLKLYTPYSGISLYYQNNVVNISADLKFNWKFWLHNTDKESLVYPEIKLRSQYSISGTSSLNLNYQYSNQIQDLRMVYDGDLFTSYRTIVNNAQEFQEDGIHRLSLRYQYSQPIKGLFFSLSASGSSTHKHSAYSTSLYKEDILIKRKQIADYHTNIFLISGRFSKSFNLWKSLLILYGSFMRTENSQFNNKILQSYNVDNYMMSLLFSARPASFFSVEWESLWSQNRMDLSSMNSKVNKLKHVFNMNFPITDYLMLSLNNTFYQSLGICKFSWFADFSIKYTHKKMEFVIDANNILNKSRYNRESISSIQKNYYYYMLRPCDITCKVSFSF